MQVSDTISVSKNVYWVLLLILLASVPFIFNGYGSEEDAWGLIVTARQSLNSGVYEVSRLPGHPLQEILLIPGHLLPSWVLCLFTLLISLTGVLFFINILKHFNIHDATAAGATLALTPVYFINGTSVMDYNWAAALIIISVYQALKGRWIFAGILIGMATGFRITSLAMVLPFYFLPVAGADRVKKYFSFLIASGLTAFILFLPPLITYGSSFFTYYQYFPYPPLLKNIYKASIGVWGVPGVIVLAFSLILIILRKGMSHKGQLHMQLFCLIILVIYSLAFLRIPQKSAFLIVMLPWIYLLLWQALPFKLIRIFPFIMALSTFFIGLNLDDPLRGSNPSYAAIEFEASGSKVSLDILKGPAIADKEKRCNKIAYAKDVSDVLKNSEQQILLIAGWYQNEIVFQTGTFETENYRVVYYEDETLLKKYRDKGYRIYYLPEQNSINDMRFGRTFTDEYATPLLLKAQFPQAPQQSPVL